MRVKEGKLILTKQEKETLRCANAILDSIIEKMGDEDNEIWEACLLIDSLIED